MWQEIPEPNGGFYMSGNNLMIYSHRMKVPGGWIVRTVTQGYYAGAPHQLFIADPSHEWKLETTNETT